MLQMRIQANMEKHTNTGPLRRHRSLAPEGSKRTFWSRQHLSLAFKSEEGLDR